MLPLQALTGRLQTAAVLGRPANVVTVVAVVVIVGTVVVVVNAVNVVTVCTMGLTRPCFLKSWHDALQAQGLAGRP